MSPYRSLIGPLIGPLSVRRDPNEPRERHLVPDPEFLESEYLDRQTDAACELQLVLDPDFL